MLKPLVFLLFIFAFFPCKVKGKSLSHLPFSSRTPALMRRKKKGYLRHRSMFAFRFLGFGETTVHQMPPCHDLFAERPSFIRILSNRLAIFVVPTDIAQTLLLSDQANLSTRCLNENSDLIFFPLNLKIKNNILLCLSEIKFTLHD